MLALGILHITRQLFLANRSVWLRMYSHSLCDVHGGVWLITRSTKEDVKDWFTTYMIHKQTRYYGYLAGTTEWQPDYQE